MDKAILKTLIYADIFDYPMLSHEVHKWLIGKEASLEQVERALKKMVKEKKIYFREGMFFLRGRNELTKKRLVNEKVSQKFYQKAVWMARLLRVIPWIRLVGISGSLAMRNADKLADIDLFVVTAVRRVWLTRLWSALMLELFGERRRRGETKKESAGKICLNLLISEAALGQPSQNLYLAHEVLQMKVLWERKKSYQKFLEANGWTKKLLPNWIGMSAVEKQLKNNPGRPFKLFDFLERVSEFWQRRYMGRLSGTEIVGHQMLYFHPEDAGIKVTKEYEQRIKRFKI